MLKHWPEFIAFAAILGVLLLDAAPDMTWINTCSDGPHYVYASKYLYVAHKGGAPLFILLGKLFLLIPFGTEFWRMTLISVIASVVASVLIYLIVKHHLKDNPKARWYGLLGAVAYGGSALVISQSTIVETYALTTMLGLLAYLMVLKNRFAWASVAIGAGLAVHPITLFVAIPIVLFNKKIRKLKYLAIVAAFGLFYLYNPIIARLNPPPYDMWSNLTPGNGLVDFFSTAIMLSGGLAIWDFPQRVLDTVGILGLSLGIMLVGLVVYLLITKKVWKTDLFWLFALPLLYFLSDLAPQTYVYLMPSIAFGVIMACIAVSRKLNLIAVWACVIVLTVVNTYAFDIGRTLDPELSATKYYREELSKVPDGQFLMPQYGWQWAMIFLYNKNEGRNIVPICVDTVVSSTYQDQLHKDGVKFDDVGIATRTDTLEKQNELATSIVRLNENVWVTRDTVPETYGTEVIQANHDESLVRKVSPYPPGQWHWKPSNPFEFITGSIEIRKWCFITLTNWNVLFFIGFASAGLIVNHLLWWVIGKRVKV